MDRRKKVVLAVGGCIVAAGLAAVVVLRGGFATASQPPLSRSATSSVEGWIGEWKSSLPVKGQVTQGSRTQFLGGPFNSSSVRTYKVHMELSNLTSYKLEAGSSLMLVETSKAGPKDEHPLEVAGGYFREAPAEDYAGAMEDRGVAVTQAGGSSGFVRKAEDSIEPFGLYDWQSGSRNGTLARNSPAWFTIMTSYSRDSQKDTYPGFGSAPSKGKLVVDSELELDVMVKSARMDQVVAIAPLLTFREGSRRADFRYLLSFSAVPAKSDTGETTWELKTADLLPMTADVLLPQVSAGTSALWKRVFATAWAGQHGITGAAAALRSIAAAKGAENNRLRATALLSSAALKDASASAQTLGIAQDKAENTDVRRAAITALGALGGPAGMPLLLSLAAGEEDVDARYAIRALAASGDKAAIEPLFRILEDDNRSSRHAVVGDALGKVADNSHLERLGKIARSPKTETAQAAVAALSGIASPEAVALLAQISEKGSEDARKSALAALGQVDRPEALAALRKAVSDSSEQVRGSAVDGLGLSDKPERTTALTEALKSPHKDVQKKAIDLLAMRKATGVLPDIAELLKDPANDAGVREEAARALGRMSYKPGAGVLAGALQHKETAVRQAAAQALGSLQDPNAAGPLTAALKDKEWEVRREAADSLGNIDSVRSVEALAAALKDEKDYVRRTAAGALGRLKYPQSVETLVGLLGDQDSVVQDNARESLEKLSGQRLGKDAAAWRKWWEGKGKRL